MHECSHADIKITTFNIATERPHTRVGHDLIFSTCDLDQPPIPSKVSASPSSWKHPVRDRPNDTAIVADAAGGNPTDADNESYTIEHTTPRMLPATIRDIHVALSQL